ncbi:MAG TPA: aminoglycoside phosphotransferase family protein, partial [Acholeplasmataceae bacterium]|nr:aminoglycoside phosphotransferase family protein [Acholeplasmataceae bacterium]
MQMFEILGNFKINGTIIHAEEYGHGHINKTYLVTTTAKEKFILQQINTDVFKKPHDVMENIEAVTCHIRNKYKEANLDASRAALEIIYTRQDKSYFKYQNLYWRCYRFIDGAKTYETITDPEQFYQVGLAVGNFQKLLSDFPIKKLKITIPDFHDTPKRFQKFLEIAHKDTYRRGMDVFNEIKFVFDRQNDMGAIVEGLENNTIPERVTHNDTKLNNIMLDEKTMEAICVIDLDTVMPGSVLYDFGDAIRVGASTAAEDEEDLSKVELDLNLFEKFSRGFLEILKDELTFTELKYLVLSTKIITLECGMRFL